jgi:hypothetical protein
MDTWLKYYDTVGKSGSNKVHSRRTDYMLGVMRVMQKPSKHSTREITMRKKKQTNWISLLGRIKLSAQGITYIPTVATEGPDKGNRIICLAKSNYDFENGAVSFKVKLTDPKSDVLVGFNHGTGDEVFAGISQGVSSYIISHFTNGKWEFLANVGMGEIPPINEDIKVEVRVNGSRIDLHINKILVCTAYYKVKPCQVALFMAGNAEFTVQDFYVSAQKPTAFVVMQFTDEFNALYNEVIKPTCEKYGLTAIRGDDIYSSGLILDDIVRSIQECFVIIADITPNNPNVFYEVGYAHGMGKATILLSDRKRDKLPFDISGFRTLYYDNTIGGKTAIEDRLSKHLKAIMNK